MKLKDKLLNGISYILVAYPVAAAVWQFVPELANIFPQYTTQIAFLTALPSAVLGAVGLKIQSYVSKSRVNDTALYTTLKSSYDEIVKELNTTKSKYQDLGNEYLTTVKQFTSEVKSLKSTNEKLVTLLKADMEVKLDNPMVKDSAKEIINIAINSVQEINKVGDINEV